MSDADVLDLHVGMRLRLRRALMGLSQERLGELLGVTFQQIQKYERGVSRVASDRLVSLARILGVPVSWFFDEFGGPITDTSAAIGVAEGAGGFVMDRAGDRRPAPARQAPLIDRRETLELVRAFNDIGDPLLRRRIYELTKALAHAGAATAPTDRRSA